MKQEPVAWVDTTYHDRVKWNEKQVKYDSSNDYEFSLPDGTPLYTAPKELSDEDYCSIGLYLFRNGEATSIEEGIRLARLVGGFVEFLLKKASDK